ncbi:MAG TPA: VCBS repeat-containing protein [Polyangiaceae bacterium]|nr:VCBS repeat-containing protein [Polyangiaceae bacterium]
MGTVALVLSCACSASDGTSETPGGGGAPSVEPPHGSGGAAAGPGSGGASTVAGAGGLSGAPEGTGGAAPVECQSDADCAALEDGDLCNGTLTCASGACVVNPATVVHCDPGGAAACHVSVCNPLDGRCEDTTAADGTFCSAVDFCTLAGPCVGGTCNRLPRCLPCETCDAAAATCTLNPGSCRVDGACVADGTVSSTNPCLACDSAAAAGWSPRIGTSCQGIGDCFQDFVCDSNGGCSGNTPVAPAVPVPTSPASGTITGRPGALPTFRWTETIDACALPTYDIQIDDSCTNGALEGCTFPSPEIDAKDLPASPYQPTSSLPLSATPPVGTRYFWRVRACRGPTCSAWSPVRYVDVGRAKHDYDGDGFTDLAAGSDSEQGIHVYYGGGSGLRGSPTAIASPAVRGSTGDLNGDGFADLVGGNLGQIYVFYGSKNGLATVPDATLGIVSSGLPPSVFAGGDFDGDGYDDVVTSSADVAEMASVFAGASAGPPTTRSYVVPNPRKGYSVDLTRMQAADVTLDALNDLVAVTGAFQGVTVLAGHGGGLVNAPVATIPGLARTTSETVAMVAGLFTEDIRADVLLAYPETADALDGALLGFFGTTTYYGSTADTTWTNTTTGDAFGADATSGRFLAQSDVLAIAVGVPPRYPISTGRVSVFSGVQPLTLAFDLRPLSGTDPNFGQAVQSPGDFDGDGVDDLVISWPDRSGTGAVLVYRGPVAATSVPNELTIASGKPGDRFGGVLY